MQGPELRQSPHIISKLHGTRQVSTHLTKMLSQMRHICTPAENTTIKAALPELYLDFSSVGCSKSSVASVPLPANTAAANIEPDDSCLVSSTASLPPSSPLSEPSTPLPLPQTSSENAVTPTTKSAPPPLSFNLLHLAPYTGISVPLEAA